MFKITRTIVSLLLLCSTLLGSHAAASAQPGSPGKSVVFLRYETANFSGSYTVEPPGLPWGTLTARGTLSNNGSGCYSLWTAVVNDLGGLIFHKNAVACGQTSFPVEVRYGWTPLSRFYARICRGEIDQGNSSTPALSNSQ